MSASGWPANRPRAGLPCIACKARKCGSDVRFQQQEARGLATSVSIAPVGHNERCRPPLHGSQARLLFLIFYFSRPSRSAAAVRFLFDEPEAVDIPPARLEFAFRGLGAALAARP